MYDNIRVYLAVGKLYLIQNCRQTKHALNRGKSNNSRNGDCELESLHCRYPVKISELENLVTDHLRHDATMIGSPKIVREGCRKVCHCPRCLFLHTEHTSREIFDFFVPTQTSCNYDYVATKRRKRFRGQSLENTNTPQRTHNYFRTPSKR